MQKLIDKIRLCRLGFSGMETKKLLLGNESNEKINLSRKRQFSSGLNSLIAIKQLAMCILAYKWNDSKAINRRWIQLKSCIWLKMLFWAIFGWLFGEFWPFELKEGMLCFEQEVEIKGLFGFLK